MCTAIFVFVICLCFSFYYLQEAKGTTAGETLKRGSLYLSSCGLKPPTLAAKLKSAAKVTVARKRNVQAELDKDDLTTVRMYMPVIKGCSLHFIKPKNQFTAYYPGAVPGSRTRTWGAVFSKAQICRAVIEWSWTEHTKATGQACPHNLSLISLKKLKE